MKVTDSDIKALTFCQKCMIGGIYKYIETEQESNLKDVAIMIKNTLMGLSKILGVSIPTSNLEYLAFGNIIADKTVRAVKQSGSPVSPFIKNYIKSAVEALTCSNLSNVPEIQKFLKLSKVCIADLELLAVSLSPERGGKNG